MWNNFELHLNVKRDRAGNPGGFLKTLLCRENSIGGKFLRCDTIVERLTDILRNEKLVCYLNFKWDYFLIYPSDYKTKKIYQRITLVC